MEKMPKCIIGDNKQIHLKKKKKKPDYTSKIWLKKEQNLKLLPEIYMSLDRYENH